MSGAVAHPSPHRDRAGIMAQMFERYVLPLHVYLVRLRVLSHYGRRNIICGAE